jgi:hypothetical protein
MTATTPQPTELDKLDPVQQGPAPRKRPSTATRKAAATRGNGGPAAAVKVKPAKDDGANVLKNKIADAMIAFVGEQFVTRETAKRLGVPYELLASEAGRTLSYAPGKAWHKNLTSPGTGRGQRHSL